MTCRADWRGDPNTTKPRDVKRILRLAHATKNDIFYDLGCGHGRVCIIVAKKVKLAVGIEDHYPTYRKAIEAVKKSGLRHKVRIRHSNFQSARISDATIAYAVALEDSEKDGEHYEKVLKTGCRFITLYLPLIGIKPDKVDYPFFMMKAPFKHAEDELDWARSVLKTKNATPTKLYKKLRSWYGRKYVRTLRRILKRRLKRFQAEGKSKLRR